MWAHFLADVFYFSSYRPTKNLCLEGLAKLLVRFGTPWTKNYLYFTIMRLEDPSYVELLTVCLREAGREDVVGLLYGVPQERALDLDALRTALRGSE